MFFKIIKMVYFALYETQSDCRRYVALPEHSDAQEVGGKQILGLSFPAQN